MSLFSDWGPEAKYPLKIEQLSTDQLSNISFLFGGIGDGSLLSRIMLNNSFTTYFFQLVTLTEPWLERTERSYHWTNANALNFICTWHCWTSILALWLEISASWCSSMHYQMEVNLQLTRSRSRQLYSIHMLGSYSLDIVTRGGQLLPLSYFN